jgi:hypothetical protein
MTEQAILQKEIEALPPKYFVEVVDFVGYLRQKAQQAAVKTNSREQLAAKDKEIINRYAEELNKEMEDVLLDQSLDI